jgi:hypothetical protein
MLLSFNEAITELFQYQEFYAKQGSFLAKKISVSLDEKFNLGHRCQNGKGEHKMILSC